MKDDRVALFTTTFYRDDEDGKLRKSLATQFAQRTIDEGYHLTVVDGGTDDGRFIEDLKRLGVDAHPETQHGLGPSRREALDYAFLWAKGAKAPYLCWSEPEKANFVGCVDRLIQKMEDGDASLVVPARKSMAEYPIAQQHSEAFGNQLHTDAGYVDVSGRPLDTFFGPKIWRREVTPFFRVFGVARAEIAWELVRMRMERAKKTYGDDDGVSRDAVERAHSDLVRTDHMMHMPTCLMVLKDKTEFGQSGKHPYNVISIPVDYIHPKEQTELETRLQEGYNGKRLMQLNALVEQFALVKRMYANGTLDNTLDEMIKMSAR